MVKLGTYAAASVVATLAVMYHAFYSREQFYPAMVYLSTSKISLLLLLNMAFVIMYAVWQLIKIIFLGTLREAEVERLNEQLWRELMEVLFAMTIFREEFTVSFVAMVTVLLFVKAFHWLAQKRVEYIEITPSVSRLSHVRIAVFMFFLLAMDSVFVHSSVANLLKTKRPSVSLFFAFEYVILATSVVSMFLKYTLYMGDMWMEGQWDNKAVYIFYLELVRDLLHLSLYLFFFLVIFINYGLPLHLVRELYEIIRNFKARVTDFIRYRKVTSNMNERFPDATPEELARSDATCIICREEMTAAKKLPCGHLFHVHCLRSWLERQQTCPTCRSPVLASEGGSDPVARRQQQGEAPREGQAITSAEANAPNPQGTISPMHAQQARLRAAAAAAAQYGSSFVYPATNSGMINWCPMYLPLVPQQYVSRPSHPAANEPTPSDLDPSKCQATESSSSSGNYLEQRLEQRLASAQGAQVFLMPVIPGVPSPRSSENYSAGNPGGQAASSNTQTQAEMQQKYLQSTIQLLQEQLNAALEMQRSLNHDGQSNTQAQCAEEHSLVADRKGKASIDATGREEAASTSGEN